MACVRCGSAAVSERSECTAQGNRRFRCRACGKQLNERSAGSLNRTPYPSDVIALVMFSEHRDMAVAKAFFESAKMVTGITPDRITTDGHDSYPRAIQTVLGAGVRHRDSQYLNNRLEQDHRGVKGRYGPMRGFKCPRSAGDFYRAYDELRDFLRSRSPKQQVSADYRGFHFLRRTATVLRVLEAA